MPNGTSEEADFTVLVQQVQEVVLPQVTDEWVDENVGEHDTVESWRASIVERLTTQRLNQARSQFIDRTTEALVGLVERDAPESMVSSDLSARVQNTVQRFQSQGIALEQWLQATGQDPAQFVESMREQSVRAAKLDLALRADRQRRGAGASTRTTSTPSTPASPCRSGRRRRPSARPTSPRTPSAS